MHRRILLIIGVLFLYSSSLLQITIPVTLDSNDLKSVIMGVQKLADASTSDQVEFQTVFQNSIKQLQQYAGLFTFVVESVPEPHSDKAPTYLLIKIKGSYLPPDQIGLPQIICHSHLIDLYSFSKTQHTTSPPHPPPNAV